MTSTHTLTLLGDTIDVKVAGRDSGGTLTAVEVVTPPGGGPPPHSHLATELFYGLEGTLDVVVDGAAVRLRPGDCVAVPGGTAHTYRNASERNARFLAVLHPAGHEHFLEELARDPARAGEIAHRHGVRFSS